MKIYQVNVTGRFSTGIICNQIHRELLDRSYESRFVFGLGGETDQNRIEMNDIWHQRLDSRFQRYFGKEGVFAGHSTDRIINDIIAFCPDLIHIHNIHGNFLNIEKFLKFLAEYGAPVVLTLHDCWAFTGGCFHFTVNGCYEWKKNCTNCKFIAKKNHPENDYKIKSELFGQIKDLSVITVSKWLKGVASESLLGSREISVIYNGIDTEIFHPVVTDFKNKIGCPDKKIVLGVASSWGKRKGLDKWIQLSEILEEEYKIVLVGVNEKQKKNIPERIIALPRVGKQSDLAELYSIADVYVNMSQEETFGLPTVEAMSCGTPSVVFNTTANPELIEKGTGIVCKDTSIESIKNAIHEICENPKEHWRSMCRSYAVNNFSYKKMTDSYIDYYTKIMAWR